MDQKQTVTQGSMENQVRNMILGNVTSADPDLPGNSANPHLSQRKERSQHQHQHQGGKLRTAQPRSAVVIAPNNGQSRNEPTADGHPHPRGFKHAGPNTLQARRQNGNQQTPQSSRGRGRGISQAPHHSGIKGQAQPDSSAHPHGAPVTAPQILRRPQQQNQIANHPATPNTFRRGPNPGSYSMRPPQVPQTVEDVIKQSKYLDEIASREVAKVEIDFAELDHKEAFRRYLEHILKEALHNYSSSQLATIELVGFGSLASGFGLPGSDMDLAIVPTYKQHEDSQVHDIDRDIPRLFEKALLDCKMGSRLLTKTRVPILKVCQQPTDELYNALLEERQRWDDLPEEEKYPQSNLPAEPASEPSPALKLDESSWPTLGQQPGKSTQQAAKVNGKGNKKNELRIDASNTKYSPAVVSAANTPNDTITSPKLERSSPPQESPNQDKKQKDQRPRDRQWVREKVLGPLDFPKSGVGIQCDINFSNLLGIHNTHLLRCYSMCDPRVRPMVLFIKAWAKTRKINSSYSGTLSSYGWVLMVLHYLVNITQPPVCPNLQLCWKPPANMSVQELEAMFKHTTISGYAVRFWRNEQEILHAAQSGSLTQNTQTVGSLIRGFFFYFASPQTHGYPRPRTFYWTNEVLSLRTPGGISTKAQKGWTGAKTTIAGGKEVRNRYLFAIEDPFELDHNVARTVTHHGIVAIRDEFRRAWRIVGAVGRDEQPEEGLFDDIVTPVEKLEEKVEDMGTVTLDEAKTEAAASDAREPPSPKAP